MFANLGGPMWVLIDVIAVAALAAALFHGMAAWKRRRNRALEQVRDDATKKLYRDERSEAA
jgi:hypothetical protein